jgi:hypothetical protein
MVMLQLARAWEFIRHSNTPEAALKFSRIRDAYKIEEGEIMSVIEAW